MRSEVTPGPAEIGPVPAGLDRPFWSVMIPTYNASPMLEEALRSVLDQDPGRDLMQIAVVDDRSTTDESRRIVDRLAPGRVEFHQGEANVGLAGNWNACLGLSRGRWVHVLHQDDLVLPGFYERLGRADSDPAVGMAFCQHAFIDDVAAWTSITSLERRGAGVIEGWLGRISRDQRVQCASAVVRRSVYEELGGYREDLRYILDWEMWVRIAARHAAWYEPTVLACYRVHEASETARLRKVSADLADLHKGLELVAAHLPVELRGTVGCELIAYLSGVGMDVATRLMSQGDYRGGMAQLRVVCRFNPRLRFSPAVLSHHKWALKLWLRDRQKRLTGPRPASPKDQARVGSDEGRSVVAEMAVGSVDRGGVDHG